MVDQPAIVNGCKNDKPSFTDVLTRSGQKPPTAAIGACTDRAQLMLSCYRRDDAHDPAIYLRAVVSVLMKHPSEVVMAVTEPASGIPSKVKWLPSVAEVVDACEAEAGYRERLGLGGHCLQSAMHLD